MRSKLLLTAMLVVMLGVPAFAELQNVEIGGSLRIRGNYFDMDYTRYIGGYDHHGVFGMEAFGKHAFIEQRTRLNVKADFTQNVSAFVEFDYYDWWGEDFRSDYLTGADYRGGSNDVALYQAYIEAQYLWDTPLSVRVGRQELALGSQFLVGVNDVSHSFTGLSFDAVNVAYTTELVALNAFAAKLAETMGDFGENDVDLYGLYASYIGIEDVALDLYWLFVRDDGGCVARFVDIDGADMHTIGLRGAGVMGGFDFDLEAAYQFGDVDGMSSACPVGFGEADVDFDALAISAEVGYTFDISWQPRMFAHFAYFGGGDPDRSLWSNDSTLPFNRLFSNVKYSEFLDNYTLFQGALSNVFVYRLGMQALVSEAVELKLVGSYFVADEYPHPKGNADKDLGWEIALYGDYNYSEDLVIRAGYAHFFGSDGLETAMVGANGWLRWGGDRDDDYDYLFLETEISF